MLAAVGPEAAVEHRWAAVVLLADSVVEVVVASVATAKYT